MLRRRAGGKRFSARPCIRADVPETTLLAFRPTRLIAFQYYVGWVFLWILALIAFWDPWGVIPDWDVPVLGIRFQTLLAALVGFLGLVAVLYAEFRRLTTRYTVTDSRVIRQDGILRKKTNQMPFSKIERVELDQSLLQRILKFGDIVLDTGEDTVVFQSVGHVNLVQDELSKIVAAYSRR